VSSDTATASFINTTGSATALAVKSEVTSGATSTSLNATYVKQAALPLNVLNAPYNVKNDGSANATPGILQAVADALVPNSKGKPSRSVYIPAGSYLLSTALDFSTLAQPSGLTGGQGAGTSNAFIDGFSFICDPGAVFTIGTMTNTSAVNLAPPTNWNFYDCDFKFGTIVDPSKQTGNNGLVLQSLSNCRVSVQGVKNFAGSGVLANPTSTIGVFNNYIDVRLLASNGNGFATLGNLLPNLYGFQGNEVHLGQVSNNSIGVNIDANGVGRTSQWNTFICGAVENSTTYGIQDSCGQNTYIITNTNSNTTAGFFLTSGAQSAPLIFGDITDTIILNGGKARILNRNDTLDDGQVTATPNTTYTTTTAADVAGLTKTVNCPGPHALYNVTFSLDVSAGAANTSAFTASLMVDGVAQSSQGITVMPTANQRGPVTQSYAISGLAAGNRVIKVNAALTAAGNYTVNQVHSTLTITRVR
jgi:hypothetical protein